MNSYLIAIKTSLEKEINIEFNLFITVVTKKGTLLISALSIIN